MISDYFNDFDIRTIIQDTIGIGGNSGYTGNNETTVGNYDDNSLAASLPANEVTVVTLVTGKESDGIVTTVTNALPITVESVDNHNLPEHQTLSEVLPVLPMLPVKMSIAENQTIRKCNWCKSNDFWLAGTELYPHWC